MAKKEKTSVPSEIEKNKIKEIKTTGLGSRFKPNPDGPNPISPINPGGPRMEKELLQAKQNLQVKVAVEKTNVANVVKGKK